MEGRTQKTLSISRLKSNLSLVMLLKNNVKIVPTQAVDYSQSKIVIQASDRDCPAHILTFGVCPLC